MGIPSRGNSTFSGNCTYRREHSLYRKRRSSAGITRFRGTEQSCGIPLAFTDNATAFIKLVRYRSEDLGRKLNADAGEGAPSSGSAPCAVKAFADADAVDIFSQSSLLPVIDGYAFRRLGSENLSDNETPALVTMMHPNGEAVRYRFHNGSATARPEPGAHRRTASRLVMVDADGAATTASPTYYDLYPGDGTRRRFRALGALDGHLGSFVSCTYARGVTVTPADMGVDVVYGTSGVRQMLTPSRLVDIAPTADWLGYDLTVHALTGTPARGAGGLYAVPSAEPLMRLRVRAENGRWRKVEVFLRKGGGVERRWLFEYGRRDWTMTAPSGLEDARGIYVEDERLAVAWSVLRQAI